MSATMKFLTGAAGLAAAVGFATPALAQYYPQPGTRTGYPQLGVIRSRVTRSRVPRLRWQQPVGQIVGQILGYGRYPYGNYGYNQYGNQCDRGRPVRPRGRSPPERRQRRLLRLRQRAGLRWPYGGYGNQYGYNQGYGNQYG